jgi:hypothetical protein
MSLNRAFFALLALLLCAVPMHATVLVSADFRELVADAQAIVHGKVIALTPQWVDDRRSIETLVTLDVQASLKGAAAGEVSFRIPGGQMGPYRTFLAGAPVFAEGDEVVVLLAARGPAIPHLVGFSQGVFRVAAADSGERVVVPLALMPTAAAPVRLVRGDPSRRPASLAAFTQQVRQLAAGPVAAVAGRVR